MTGQDGGFRGAAARFSAEVDSALTRARRAASEARAQSAGFRGNTRELAEQAKTGRLRGVRRDQVEPTAPGPRTEAMNFRQANGLANDLIARLPDAGTLIAGLPAAPAGPVPAQAREDEDFSEREVLVDVDSWDGPAPADRPEHDPQPPGIDSPRPQRPLPNTDEDYFSQQRILLDVDAEPYHPDDLQAGVFGLEDEQNRR